MASSLQPPPPVARLLGDPRYGEFDRALLLLWERVKSLEARIEELEAGP